MHIHTFTLRRVFDIQPLHQRWFRSTTDFSFETDEGQRVMAVQVKGHPRPQAGDRITAVLAKPDDWGTLLLWHNTTRGETHRNLVQPVLMAGLLLMTVGWAGLSLLGHAPMPWVLLLAALFSMPGWIRDERTLRRARQQLTPVQVA